MMRIRKKLLFSVIILISFILFSLNLENSLELKQTSNSNSYNPFFHNPFLSIIPSVGACECDGRDEWGGDCNSGGCGGRMRRTCPDGCNWGGWYCETSASPYWGNNCYHDACGGTGEFNCRGVCIKNVLQPSNFGDSCNPGACGSGSIGCDGTCRGGGTPNGYGQSCGSCGGVVQCGGTCSISTPSNYGESCGDFGGTIVCDGTCSGEGVCSSGETQCLNGKYQVCSDSNVWEDQGVDSDGDGVDQQCGDSTCDNSKGVCDSAVGSCIAKTSPENLCSDLLDNDCDGNIDLADQIDCFAKLPTCGNGVIDTGETCFNCADDAGCTKDNTCVDEVSGYICKTLTAGVCGNNNLNLGETCSTCSQDIPSGICNLCDNDGICEIGEGCLCGDCLQEQGQCILGDICNTNAVCEVDPNDGFCTSDTTAKNDDPECCSIVNALWGSNITTTNSVVALIVEGNNECTGIAPTLEVFEEDPVSDDLVIPGPQTTAFSSTIKTFWTVPDLRDGLFGGEAELYFTATQGLSSKQSELLTVIECDVDDTDCDGVKDVIDQCPDTPLEKVKLVDNVGCAPGEASCLADWDCSNAEWTQCNERGFRARDVTKCVYNGGDSLCESDYTPISRRRCITEAAFPVFTFSNLLITLSILSLFYLFSYRKRK